MRNIRKLTVALLAMLAVLCIVCTAAAATATSGPCKGADSVRNGGNHSWNIVEQHDPTCTEDGVTVKKCVYCDETSWETRPAHGHSWSEWDEMHSPTCTQDGQASRWCKNCGLREDQTIPALGHDWGQSVVTVQPTCTTEGTEGRTCNRCGIHEDKTIPALGHIFGDWKVVKEPTCTEKGLKERTCGRCGLLEQQEIEALGHKWGHWKTTVEPTCTESGLENHSCSRCGKTNERTIDPLGHDWGPWVVVDASTCIHHGKEVSTCRRCGLEGERELPLTDHIWGPWYIVVKAVPGTPGLEESDCEVCGFPRYREYEVNGEDAILTPELILNAVDIAPAAKHKLGETITYNALAVNVGDLTLYDVTIVCRSDDNPDSVGVSGVTCAPYGAGLAEAFGHDVTIPADFAGTQYHVVFQAYGFTADAQLISSNAVPFTYDIDTGFGWEPPPAEAMITKKVISTPARPEGYQLGEKVTFEIDYAIDCSEDFPAVNVTVEDEGVILDSMDKMTGPGHAVFNSGVENPGVKLVYATYMEHTITEEDVEACVFSNVATLKWSDDFGTYERQSNTVSVPVVKLDLVEPVITKYYTNVPKNGMYFTPDEVIDFAIHVSNVSTTETYRLFVTDPINPNAVVSAPQGPAANVSIHGMGVTWDDLVLAPGETVTLNVQYKVTWMDAEDGFMQNLAYYRGSNQAGEAIFNGCDPVIVPCGHDLPNVPELEKKPTLSKQAMTAPANGTYYTAGETVTYQITLTNTTDFALNNVSCTDVMTGAVPAFLGQESSIAVGASHSWSFVYTVTAADVKRGYISNFAYAQYDINQIDGGVISNVVVLDTDGKSNEPKTDRDGKRIVTHGKADICTRTLDGEAEGVLTYVRHICRKHLAVANEAAALIQMPGSGDETCGWNGALQLWLNAIDEQYSDLCSWNNDPAMQALIMEEQSAWKSQFNAWRSALTGTAAQNAQQAAEAAQRKAEQLCYEAHTAPATRLDTHNDQQLAASTVKAVTCGLSVLEPGMPDSREAITLCADHRSVLTEAGSLLPNAHTGYERVTIWKAAQSHWLNMLDQYTNACYAAAPDAAAQRLVAVERVTFGNWLEARKAMLEGLYSSNANAEEVLANELMNRVMEHCGK